MRDIRRNVVALLAAAAIALAACGGTPGGGDPAGTVSAAFAAAESGGFGKLVDYACAAKKDDVSNLFGGGSGLEQLTAAGITMDELFAAMQLKFADIKTTETSKSGDKATVHVTGKVTMNFDAAKFRPIVKKILEAQGMTVDDAMIDAALAGMSGQLSQTQDIDEDVEMVQEGGKWTICD